jgi:protein O-mannosyl-transferase
MKFSSENTLGFKNEKLGYSDKNRNLLRLVLFIFSFLLYSNTLNHGYVLDDYSVISENTVTQEGIEAIPNILSHYYRYGHYSEGDGLYRPLSVVMFAIEWTISPNNPTIHHFINVLIYAFTSSLLFLLLSKLFQSYSILIPFFITLLFAAHPIHTEVVANIKSRDELMAFFFSLLTLLYFWKYLQAKNYVTLIVSGLFYFLSLLSKETAIQLVLIIPFIIYFFQNYRWKEYVLPTSFFGVISILFLFVRQIVLANNGFGYVVSNLENPLISLSLLERFPTSIFILSKYILLLIFPENLVYDYSFNQIPLVNSSDIGFLLSFIIVLFILSNLIIRFKKKEAISFGVLFFLVTIILFTNLFITIGTAMGERFLYYPSLGFCIVLTFIVLKLTPAESLNKTSYSLKDLFVSHKKTLWMIGSICLLYSFKTISRNADWKDNYTLYSQDQPRLNNNAKSHLLFGIECIKKGETNTNDSLQKFQYITKGINEVLRSKAIYPTYLDTWTTLGNAYQLLGNYDLAIKNFAGAQKIDLTSSNGNLGDIYFEKKDFQKAIEYYMQEINFHPKSVKGYNNLGMSLATLGRYDSSLYYLHKGWKIAPNDRDLNLLLANVYKAKGDEANFLRYYTLANQITP